MRLFRGLLSDPSVPDSMKRDAMVQSTKLSVLCSAASELMSKQRIVADSAGRLHIPSPTRNVEDEITLETPFPTFYSEGDDMYTANEGAIVPGVVDGSSIGKGKNKGKGKAREVNVGDASGGLSSGRVRGDVIDDGPSSPLSTAPGSPVLRARERGLADNFPGAISDELSLPPPTRARSGSPRKSKAASPEVAPVAPPKKGRKKPRASPYRKRKRTTKTAAAAGTSTLLTVPEEDDDESYGIENAEDAGGDY